MLKDKFFYRIHTKFLHYKHIIMFEVLIQIYLPMTTRTKHRR